MPVLPSPKALLDQYGLRAKKSFGQNFLVDASLATRIAELCARLGGRGTVVEIGAGLGALTAPLLERFAVVIAIERDRDLVPVLRELFAQEVELGRLALEEADAQQVDVAALLHGHPEPYVLAGNLPYQLTGVLFRKVTTLSSVVHRVVFLVQSEVADRLTARPGSSEYGALTVFMQARYELTRALIVRRGAFYPQPQVDSAVVVLTPRDRPLAEETELFKNLVHAAFQQRRKKLRNAWQDIMSLPRERIAMAAARANIDLDRRGETLDVADFARMAEGLSG